MQNQNELAQFDKLKADITLFVEPVFDIVVESNESADTALTSGKEVKSWLKKVEERRKELVGPYNERVKQINEYAKQITEPLLKAEAHVKKGLGAWEEKLEKLRAEEMRKAEEARKKAEAEAQAKLKAQQEEASMEALFQAPAEQKRAEIIQQAEAQRVQKEIADSHKENVRAIGSMKVSGARKIWKCRVTNIEDVPVEYLDPNITRMMRDFMDGKVKQIPGVEFYQETSVALR